MNRRNFLSKLGAVATVPFVLRFTPIENAHKATVYLELANGTRHAWPNVPFVCDGVTWSMPDCKLEALENLDVTGVTARIPLGPFGLPGTRMVRFGMNPTSVMKGNSITLTGLVVFAQ